MRFVASTTKKSETKVESVNGKENNSDKKQETIQLIGAQGLGEQNNSEDNSKIDLQEKDLPENKGLKPLDKEKSHSDSFDASAKLFDRSLPR